MLKAIKIKLYPNDEQVIYMNKLLGCYRKVYNECLALKKMLYVTENKSIGLKELGNYFHQELTKNKEYEYLTEHNTKILKQSIINLLDAYKRFFINGTGFPKFKSKNDNRQSARFPVDAISRKNIYSNNKITLTSQLKNLKFKCSDRDKRYLSENKDKIRSATLTKTKTDKYFLSILIDGAIEYKYKPINEIIGIDIGIKTFVQGSNGISFENLKLKHKNEKKLKRLHRQLSKKQNRSKNKIKARKRLAKAYEKINNIKLNYLHNITTKLVRENQTIVIEDLNVKGMLKNHNLAKSIQDLSIHEFCRQLNYKCMWNGRNLIQIDRWFPSSKLCSNCGHKYKELKLNEREWICSKCGTKHDRDLNAAINIENEGKRIVGNRFPELKLADHPTIDDISSNTVLKSSNGMKQENVNETNCLNL